MSVTKTKNETITYSVTEPKKHGAEAGETEFYRVTFHDGEVTGINVSTWFLNGGTLPARLLAHLQLLLEQLISVEGHELSYKMEGRV